jgi:hypothetical protein
LEGILDSQVVQIIFSNPTDVFSSFSLLVVLIFFIEHVVISVITLHVIYCLSGNACTLQYFIKTSLCLMPDDFTHQRRLLPLNKVKHMKQNVHASTEMLLQGRELTRNIWKISCKVCSHIFSSTDGTVLLVFCNSYKPGTWRRAVQEWWRGNFPRAPKKVRAGLTWSVRQTFTQRDYHKDEASKRNISYPAG